MSEAVGVAEAAIVAKAGRDAPRRARAAAGAGAGARLEERVATFILAGGEGRRLHPLTAGIPKPAVPFGTDGRIVDFVLESCLASGITSLAVLTQYLPGVLERYLVKRHAPRFLAEGGILALVRQGVGPVPLYPGNADAILAGLPVIDPALDTLLVLAADHVYRMDHADFVGAHLAAGADLTIAAVPVPVAEARRFGVIEAAPDGAVRGFVEKPPRPRPLPDDPSRALASMGIYVIRRQALAAAAAALGKTREVDFGRDLVPAILAGGGRVRVFAHRAPVGGPGTPAWFDVGTPEALLEASLAVHGAGAIHPAAQVDGRATVERSVLRAGVVVGPLATVSDSFLLDGATVGAGARLRRAIVGPGVHIPAGARLEPEPAGASGPERAVVVAAASSPTRRAPPAPAHGSGRNRPVTAYLV